MSIAEREFSARFLGEYCCRNDTALTLVGGTSSLARLLGYTVEEISSVYQNSLIAMVTAEGQYILQNTLAETDDIECVFPVYHKNGNAVWVLNRAVRQTDEDGNA